MTIDMHAIDAYTTATSIADDGATVRLHAEPSTARITIDEGWSPYVQAELTTPLPLNDALAKVDPRAPIRVQVTAQRKFGHSDPASAFSESYGGKTAAYISTVLGGRNARYVSEIYFDPFEGTLVATPITATLDLTLRGRTIDQAAGEVTYSLASDEQLLQDYALVADQPTAPGGALASDVVRFALRKIGAYLAPGYSDAPVDVASIVWSPGVTAWDYLAPILQAAGLRLFCDELRTWRLVPATYDTGTTLITIATGTNATEASDTITRDGEWFDSVVVVYRWTDDDGSQHTRYDSAASFPHSKTLTVEYDAVYPGPGAAQKILARSLGRGHQIIAGAVNDYAARPGNPILVTLPNTPALSGRVASVTWNFPGDEMSVTTRNMVEE